MRSWRPPRGWATLFGKGCRRRRTTASFRAPSTCALIRLDCIEYLADRIFRIDIDFLLDGLVLGAGSTGWNQHNILPAQPSLSGDGRHGSASAATVEGPPLSRSYGIWYARKELVKSRMCGKSGYLDILACGMQIFDVVLEKTSARRRQIVTPRNQSNGDAHWPRRIAVVRGGIVRRRASRKHGL